MPQDVWVHCPFCETEFPVPDSLRGGHANCPHCRRAVEVGQDFDWLFWSLVGMGAMFVIALSAGAFLLGSMTAGFTILGIGTAIILAIVLAS